MVLIHICIIVDYTNPDEKLKLRVGGIANQVLLLLNSYEKINDIKISLITRFSKYKPNSERIKIYQLHRFNNSVLDEIYYIFNTFITILKIHKYEPIDILNIHHYTIFKIVPIIIRLIFNIPIIMKMPNNFSNFIKQVEIEESHSLILKIYSYSWLKFFKKFLLKKINYIIAMNPEIVNELIELNYPINRILILPNGISFKEYNLIKKTERKHINYGFVGRLIEIKNLRFILNTFKKYFKIYPSDKLLIYGEGPEINWIIEFINKNNLHENIIYQGFQKDKTIIYSSIDVLINGSFTEGISNSILEAFSTNTFVIASNISGNRELIHHKVTGLLFNPYKSEDLIEQLIIYKENKFLNQNLIENAKNEIIKKYDIDLITNNIYYFLKSKMSMY